MISIPRPERYSRRALLKGMGVGMGMLPLLHSERVRAQSSGVAKRFISIIWGSGVAPPNFYPPAGALATLPMSLAAFETVKQKMLVVRGKGTGNGNSGGIDYRTMVDAGNTFGGHSSYKSTLTGTSNGSLASIDTLIAAQLATTGFQKAQLNVGCRPGSSSTSWRGAGVKNTSETDPYRLFTTLFSGATMTPTQVNTLLVRRKSVLDHVLKELTTFQNRVGTDDKMKIGAHMDSIRQIESQLSDTVVPIGAGCAPPPNTPAGLNFKTVSNYPTHIQLMMDLVGAAVKCDMARAITMDLADNGGSNGLTFDAKGNLVLCQHGERRVARVEAGGHFTPLADHYQGKRFNSPNDLVYRSNGDLYFTDPAYGLPKTFDDPARELTFAGVYRLAKDGTVTLLVQDLKAPNGIAFSPDEKTLYVTQSDPARAIIMAYDVAADGLVKNGRVFFDMTAWVAKERPGLPDGMKVDRAGNVLSTGPGGIHVFTDKGEHLGTIATGVPTSNCGFGDDGSTLYVTANTTLCRIRLATKGLGF